MKRNSLAILILVISSLMIISCGKKTETDNRNNPFENRGKDFPGGKDFGKGMMFGEGAESVEVTDQIKYLSEDCVENYFETTTVEITFKGTNAISGGQFATKEGVTLYKDSDDNSVMLFVQKETDGENSEAHGITIEYKGNQIIRYVLSGSLEGTLKIKSKNADCIVELDGLSISSTNNGPCLQFTGEKYRTFIVVNENTENTFTDNRTLSDEGKILNEKKGSVYAKGTMIITGPTSKKAGGSLTIINKGYKHGIYSGDYIRIADVSLNVDCEGETSRDCIRTLNGVIIDGGNINLVTKGSISDDEGCGIKVQGENSDDDKKTVEYTAGAGFVVINGGTINITSTGKGITAHWKSGESAIGKTDYKVTKNESKLYEGRLVNANAEKPEPYFIMNDGDLKITTTLEPVEGKCSPEGIEAKYDIIINGGSVDVNATDDAINAGAAVVINGGSISANSSRNDAIDANGPSGITINDGEVWGYGVSVPECAFDSDMNPFNINGGTVVGFGSVNFTTPSDNSVQNVIVLGTSGYSGKTLEVVQNGKSIINCDLSVTGRSDILILSSAKLSKGDFDILVDGKSVSTGTVEGKITTVNYSGEGGFGGGPGGFGGGGPGNFDGNMPDFSGMEPPEGMTPPDGFTPPEGFTPQDGNNFPGGKGRGKPM